MKDNSFFLKHILDSIRRIRRYLDGVTFEEFVKDEMRVGATVRELEIIGEAASKLDMDFCASHPEVQWQKMISMRNFLIHQYFGVSEKVVWGTYKNDLDELEKEIMSLLQG
ncbi:DUF86 domain-containing protein [Patescibacteria group bacterium]|nr:DUF86 domain-containing protein [Patescibacteria group bacterium]